LRVVREDTAVWSDPVTFGITGPGFGDVWKSVQYAQYVARTHSTAVRLYPYWHGWPGANFSPTPLADKRCLIEEILTVLDNPRPVACVSEVSRENQVCLLERWPMHFPQLRTRRRWDGWSAGEARRITYQFDGAWEGQRKNPPPEDVARLLAVAPGCEYVRLGKPLPVRACVEAAATSDAFIGVDSGMAQLCYCVGVPVLLVSYEQDSLVLFAWHGSRHALYCADTDDLLFKVRLFLGMPHANRS
jgi:hypothetical protein